MDKSNIIIITHNCQTYIWLIIKTFGDIVWKEHETMQYELSFPQTSLHNLIWMASEVFAILEDHFQHIYIYVSNFHTQELCN